MRGSLTGSVIGNLLLVLGFSLIAGGVGRTDRASSFLSFGLIAVATLLFLIVAVPGWDGDPDRHSLAHLTIPVSIALLVLYVAATWYSLRRHRQHARRDRRRGQERRLVVPSRARRPRRRDGRNSASSPRCSSARWRSSPRRRASPTSSSPQSSSRSSATPPSTAVQCSSRTAGKIQLAAEIALSSAAQVAVFLIPAVALLSWLIEPLALSFRQVEIAMLAASLLITVAVLFDGRTSRLRGGILRRRLHRRGGRLLPGRRAVLEAQSYPVGFVPRTTNPGTGSPASRRSSAGTISGRRFASASTRSTY